MNNILLLVTGDSECRLEVEAAASRDAIDCYQVSFGEHLSELVHRFRPFLLIIDFTARENDWLLKHLSEIKDDYHDFPVIGIITGENDSDSIRLERAGCSKVLTKEQFKEKAKYWIDKYYTKS